MEGSTFLSNFRTKPKQRKPQDLNSIDTLETIDTPVSNTVAADTPTTATSNTPATDTPVTDTTTRKAELAAKKAALVAEAKAIVAAERAAAKKARELAKAKIKAEQEALKETAKMLLEIATQIKKQSYRYLEQLEIEFAAFGDYIEIIDIAAIDSKNGTSNSVVERLENRNYFYWPANSKITKAGFDTYDSILTNVIEEHISYYLPPDQDVNGKVVVALKAEPANKVQVYLQNEPEAAPAFPETVNP